MSRKSKGINAERELIHMFWKNGWAAVRVAGSGANKYPSPDILAAKSARKLAIEAKTTKDDVKYFTKEEISQILTFSSIFGAEAWLALKFKGYDWFFMSLEDIKATGSCYAVSAELAQRRGLLFKELVSE